MQLDEVQTLPLAWGVVHVAKHGWKMQLMSVQHIGVGMLPCIQGSNKQTHNGRQGKPIGASTWTPNINAPALLGCIFNAEGVSLACCFVVRSRLELRAFEIPSG